MYLLLNSLILLVDDEQSIIRLLEVALQKEGFTQISTATTGSDAIQKSKELNPKLIILDIMLPGYGWIRNFRQIRTFSQSPIFFLSAKSEDTDKILGFGIGANDYVTKPFSPSEVVARIKAQLRRSQVDNENTLQQTKEFDYGRFKVSESHAQLTVAGQDVTCPARKLKLLIFLCKHPNQVFSREHLYEKIWGFDSIGDEKTVNVHIRRLREKIEVDPSSSGVSTYDTRDWI